jgi:rhomboid family GlyGly-CTERM serine protease
MGAPATPRIAATFDCAWSVALAALAAIATVTQAGWLVADAAGIGAGELWRLVTGPFVHVNTGHFARDVALLVIVGVAYEAPLRRGFGWLMLALLVAPTVAVLVAHPELDAYFGLSGLTHGLIAAALVYELRRPRTPLYAYAIAAALAGKVIYEVVAGAPLFPMSLGDSVRQVPIAHAAGAAVGVLFAVLFGQKGPGREAPRASARSVAGAASA